MIRLRPARDLDAGAVGEILSSFTDDTDWMPRIHSRAEDIAHAAALIARGWVTVAERAGCVVGFAANDGADLDALYVRAQERGKGIGSALIDHLKARQERLELWTFQANEAAQKFYLSHGFCEERRSDGAENDEGLPDIFYLWRREVA